MWFNLCHLNWRFLCGSRNQFPFHIIRYLSSSFNRAVSLELKLWFIHQFNVSQIILAIWCKRFGKLLVRFGLRNSISTNCRVCNWLSLWMSHSLNLWSFKQPNFQKQCSVPISHRFVSGFLFLLFDKMMIKINFSNENHYCCWNDRRVLWTGSSVTQIFISLSLCV